ncbi:MAG: cobalt-precorrin hydrolase / cobalt-factor methyltransferase / precorrin-3B [Actinomycetota bacterium]|nr:cobalt-precorrin hydrolase / cobalt-factor methyltransferase / precorrin-3B [Actinomycetota bacterium]
MRDVSIGVVATTAAGRRGAARLAEVWGEDVRIYKGPVARALPRAFAECRSIVAFTACGVVVRILAPLLVGRDTPPGDGSGVRPDTRPTGGKHGDPGVVCVDEGGHHAIALLGGHAGGANDLALRVSEVLRTRPVITTGTDSVGLPGLDDLGLPCSGDVAGVARAILDGDAVRLDLRRPWPLPALGRSVRENCGPDLPRIVVTDEVVPDLPDQVVLHPPVLVLGVGASSGAPAEELADLVSRTLEARGLSPAAVGELVTVDLKAREPALLALAEHLGVRIRTFPAPELAGQPVPTPSEVVRAAVGTASVAEAAVLAAGAELVVTKQTAPATTLAVGRLPVRGRLTLVGIGPGARDLLTARAVNALRRAGVVIGLDQYVAQIQDLLRPGAHVVATGMGTEEKRARTAVGQAQAGREVVLVGSGDAGVYAMASPALQALQESLAEGGPTIDVEGVPGVTAALAAASQLGAPLGHDHACISLSDLHTPWEIIEKRLVAAAEGDFTVALYNPRSRGRSGHLDRALTIFRRHRPGTTPIGVVRDATRPAQKIWSATLDTFDSTEVDMYCLVIVGSSTTTVVDGHIVTPRGYRWLG